MAHTTLVAQAHLASFFRQRILKRPDEALNATLRLSLMCTVLLSLPVFGCPVLVRKTTTGGSILQETVFSYTFWANFAAKLKETAPKNDKESLGGFFSLRDGGCSVR